MDYFAESGDPPQKKSVVPNALTAIKRKVRASVPWFIVLVVSLATILTMRSMNSSRSDGFTEELQVGEESFRPDSELEPLETDGMQEVARSDVLALYADSESGHVEIEVLESGYRWTSMPDEQALERETSSGTWRENIESPLIIETASGLRDVSLRMTNSLRSDVSLRAYELNDGVRFVFDFLDEGVTVGYELHLRQDHFSLVVPPELVGDGDGRVLLRYHVLPFLGAARSELEDGYLVVPDGSGALIRFDETRRIREQYVGRIYGGDPARAPVFRDVRQAALVRVPAFGISHTGGSLLGVIHDGASSADILGVPAGLRTGFNFATVRFDHRFRYRVVQDLLGGGFTRISEGTNDVRREIRYFPVQNDERAAYANLANRLQDYFVDTLGVHSQSTPGVPLEVTLFGGAENELFLGTQFIPLTTFEDARTIIDRLSAEGVSDAHVTFRNWEGIHEWRGLPDRMPPASELGGASGLEELADSVRGHGYRLTLAADFVTGGQRGGYRRQADTIHNILREPVPVFIEQDTDVYRLGPRLTEEHMRRDTARLSSLGVDGVLLDYIGSELSSDYNPRSSRSREAMAAFYRDIVSEQRESGVEVHLLDPNMNMLPVADGIAFRFDAYPHMMSGSFQEIMDEQVPFFQIALYGLLPYTNQHYNLFDEPEVQFLRAIEYGANVSFLITAESPAELRLTEAAERLTLPSTEFDLILDDMIQRYEEIRAIREETGESRIVDHRIVGDVHRTVFESGLEIIVNYGSSPVSIAGHEVDPLSYVLSRGATHEEAF